MKIIYTKHAEKMLAFRTISKALVKNCIKAPDKILPAREGKKTYLKDFGNNYLKVVAVEEKDNLVIITQHWLAKKRVKM